MPEIPDAVAALLARQDGLATHAQLLEHGVSQEAVRWNSGRGWKVVLPRVLLVTEDELTDRRRLVAGLLWAGPGAVLAGPTAARLLGIRSADPGGTVHLLVEAPRASRSAGFARVRRTLLVDHHEVVRGGLRLSSPARAAVDAARAARTREGRTAILVEAVQRRVAGLDDIAEWVHRLRTRDAACLKAPMEAAASGAWSVPEHAVLELLATSARIPGVWANPGLVDASGRRLTTPDAWCDDVALAVMVHSHRHHSQGEQWDATVAADADLVAAGVVVVGVTPAQVRRSPTAVRERVERAYAVAAARPRPGVRATPQHLRSA